MEEWFVGDKRHNLNGPAIKEYTNQGELINDKYFIDNKEIDPFIFFLKSSQKELIK